MNKRLLVICVSHFLLTAATSGASGPSASISSGRDGLVLPVRTVDRPALGSCARPAIPTVSSDSLRQIAQIYAALNGSLTFGDTDHDSLNEVILAYSDGNFTYRILEEQGDNIYREEYIGPYMNPYAAGDFDQDGKSEILGQPGASLVVYESTSPSTYPTVLSWQSPPLGNVIGYATVADTDRDGRMEILHSINGGTSRFIIFENTGDNEFVQVFFRVMSPQDDGPKLVADLDEDGLTEIAFCGTYGYLHIFESPADNVWQETFSDSTGLINAYPVTGGVDSDGNGRPELFLEGEDDLRRRSIYIYEAVSDNRFARIATLFYDDRHVGGSAERAALADIDDDGRAEYMLVVFRELLIYHAVAPGQWILISQLPDSSDSSHTVVKTYDVNRNKRPEVFWAGTGNSRYGSTLIFEHPPLSPSDVSFNPQPPPEAFTLFPNPCRTTATMLLGPRGRAAASAISVFDASGRLVTRQIPVRDGSDRLIWSTLPLRPGLYFLQLENGIGTPLARGRLVVLR